MTRATRANEPLASAPLRPDRRCGVFTAGMRRCATWLLAAGLTVKPGFAADPLQTTPGSDPAPTGERVVELNEQGSALYAAGDYRRAAERFLQAYAVDEDPNLLFNIASCYEELGDLDAAIEKYRAFLAAPRADPEGRPRAEAAIARLTAVEAPPLPTVEPAEQPPVAPPLPVAAAPTAPPDKATHGGGWVPWVGLAGGVALGALGAVFYRMGSADHSEVSETPGFGDPQSVAGITRRRADDLIRAGDTKKAIGLTSATAGGALIVGSIVWWLVDPLKPPSQSGALEVMLHPSQTELRYGGVF